jgi:hypothetical protein
MSSDRLLSSNIIIHKTLEIACFTNISTMLKYFRGKFDNVWGVISFSTSILEDI